MSLQGLIQLTRGIYWVFRGDYITFTCNISMNNTLQINWTKDRFLFSHALLNNLTFSNFTSHRVRIDLDFHSKLSISNVQHDDAGMYVCNVTDRKGTNTIQWNLTVSEKPEEIISSQNFLYILTPVIGFLLCGITSAVCLCRKHMSRSPREKLYDRSTLSIAQFHVQLGGESLQVIPPEPRSCIVHRHVRSRQHF
ncbi:uncharacterized protein LOC108884418 isoform X3 [Lates calcarifer]|uniref:Uncharacterized protein LOC108884418 isoform X3 n=1 Tax=Lates calcarifer TaxID=8187 RepID=A0AAJ8B5N2_LATCA|nr:uncharacterized protein LOC108884418 isoform X3 [Lates calcarifer]